MNFVKSPLNYVGGKFKILPQIIPLFPDKITTFIDLFGGGANISLNVKANRIIYNDTLTQVVDFLKMCKQDDWTLTFARIELLVDIYQLDKENVKGYKELRDDYNSGNRAPEMFYALVCHSFNNQIRFNKKGEFNLPFGRRSSFNPALKEKFIGFLKCIQSKNISFCNMDFRKLNFDKIGPTSFVYCDPPYLISTASYNESGGWTEVDETDLLNLLDSLNSRQIKFALSNVLENKGFENKILKEWAKKYCVHSIKNDFKNSNHQRKDVGKTIEVLITNY